MRFGTEHNPLHLIKRDKQFNAMCCHDHVKIGFNTSEIDDPEDERCPLCRLIDENEMLKGKVEYLEERLRGSYGKSHF